MCASPMCSSPMCSAIPPIPGGGFAIECRGAGQALKPAKFGLIYFGRPEVTFLIYVEDSAG